MEIEDKELTSGEKTLVKKANSSGFSRRLREAMAGRSIREFASSATMSAGTLHNYLNDESLPTLDKLISLANTASVSLNWLATGRGSVTLGGMLRRESSDDATEKLDLNVLTEAIKCIEQAIDELGITMSPEKKSLVTASIYDLFSEQRDEPVSRTKVFRLIESAIA